MLVYTAVALANVTKVNRHGGCRPRTGQGRKTVSYLKCRCRLVAGLGLASLLVVSLFGPTPLAADEDPQLKFGVDMAKRGLWSEALFRFRQAEESQPGNPRVLNNLAVAYEAVGLFEEALTTYQAALKADPASRELRRNYARFIEFYQSFKPDDEAAEEAQPETEVPAALERPVPEAPESSAEDVSGP
jgi:tetratricopeptide (TPR) repeat protein